jgi:hypothetical protein
MEVTAKIRQSSNLLFVVVAPAPLPASTFALAQHKRFSGQPPANQQVMSKKIRA